MEMALQIAVTLVAAAVTAACAKLYKITQKRTQRLLPGNTANAELKRYLQAAIEECSHTHHIGISTERISLELNGVFIPLHADIRKDLLSQPSPPAPMRNPAISHSSAHPLPHGNTSPDVILTAPHINAVQPNYSIPNNITHTFGEHAFGLPFEYEEDDASISDFARVLWPLGDPQLDDGPLAIYRTNQLVLLGNAGTGKTTLLRYTCLALARILEREEASVELRELGLRICQAPVPIYLRLTRLSASLPAPADPVPHGMREQYASPSATIIDAFIAAELNRLAPSDGEFLARARERHSFLYLFDGLDETSEGRRLWISRCLEAFASAHPNDRIVVTSRPPAVEPRVVFTQFKRRSLCPLGPNEQKTLLERWFAALSQRTDRFYTSAESVRALLKAIHSNAQLAEMAGNPLLLTCMAIMQANRTTLPDQRTKLYDELITILLDTWRRMQVSSESLGVSPSVAQMATLRRRVERLAFEAHSRLEQVRTFSVEESTTWIRDTFPRDLADIEVTEKVHELLGSLSLNSGLLSGVDRTFQFSHLSFQEFLAASHLLGRPDVKDFFVERHKIARWREPILLGLGLMAQGHSLDQFEAIVRRMAQDEDTASALMAAQALLESGVSDELADCVQLACARLATDAWRALTDPDLRIECGTAAWRLGRDLRPTSDVTSSAYWSRSTGAGSRVGIFPVTVSDFSKFLQAHGHESDLRPPTGLNDANPGLPVLVPQHLAKAYAGWLAQFVQSAGTRLVVARSLDHDSLTYPPDMGRRGTTPLRPIGIFPEHCSAEGVQDHGPYTSMREWRSDTDMYMSSSLVSSFRLALLETTENITSPAGGR